MAATIRCEGWRWMVHTPTVFEPCSGAARERSVARAGTRGMCVFAWAVEYGTDAVLMSAVEPGASCRSPRPGPHHRPRRWQSRDSNIHDARAGIVIGHITNDSHERCRKASSYSPRDRAAGAPAGSVAGLALLKMSVVSDREDAADVFVDEGHIGGVAVEVDERRATRNRDKKAIFSGGDALLIADKVVHRVLSWRGEDLERRRITRIFRLSIYS